MSKGTQPGGEPAEPARRWSFGRAILDERSRELFVDGKPVEVERKPLEVLIYLLHHAGEVVTKDELLQGVWPGRVLTEQVLTRCIGKLRDALDDADQSVIKTSHGYGYRLVAPVRVEGALPASPPRLDFKAGDHPPSRPNWRLEERLGTGGHGEVWLARHVKTREQRVYKFALEDSCLSSLKREITVSRLLHDSLGARGGAFVRVLEWNLDERPYFLECEYASGGSLVAWAQAQGGLDKIPLAQRIGIVIEVAEALAAAHSIDVLHKDLKPSNVLIEPQADGAVRVRLCDFGSGGILDAGRLSDLGITQMGFTRTLHSDGTTSGTPLYFPPEILAGQPATRQSDVFSLGVILYQMVVGDLRRPLAPGWEHDVDDAQLREDIGLAAAGNPQRRLKSAQELLDRLRNLERRRPQPETDDGPVSIAILPFVDLGGDAADEWFAASTTDELITAFARLDGLRVASFQSVLRYKDRQDSLAEVGKALKVKSVLAGEIEHRQGQLRVAAKLCRTATGRIAWSHAWKRPAGELFAIQEELARAVAAELGLQVPSKAGAKIVRQGTENLPAYRAYLRGKKSSWKNQDEAVNRQALADLQEAVTLDPHFAKAHAEIPGACWARIYWIEPDDQAALKLGFAAAERALALDPTLAEAHFARGQLAFTPTMKFAYGMAAKEFRRALAINGRLGSAWGQLAGVYQHVGLMEECRRVLHKGLESDPADFGCNFTLATVPIWEGRYEEGLDAVEQLPRDVNPTIWYWHTIWALVFLERTNEAEARIDQYFANYSDKGGLMTSMRALMHARAGRHDEAEKFLAVAASVDQRFGHYHHTAYELACTCALLNRRSDALKYLHQAIHTGFPCCGVIERDPHLESLKGDPELEKILEWPRQHCDHIKSLAGDD